VQLTQQSSQGTALLAGTSLGCTKIHLPQGRTRQFPSNCLRTPICKNSFTIIPEQYSARPLRPAISGQSLLTIARSKKRKKLRGVYCSFFCAKLLHPCCCAT